MYDPDEQVEHAPTPEPDDEERMVATDSKEQFEEVAHLWVDLGGSE